jgi:hypothetical protein
MSRGVAWSSKVASMALCSGFVILFSSATWTGARAQKFPSCVDSEAQQKVVSLLTRWIENETKEVSDGSIQILSVDIQNIFPRNARFGNYSGILECEVTANVVLLKRSTGQRFVLPAFKNFALYFGYDQSGDLVVQTPKGFQ